MRCPVESLMTLACVLAYVGHVTCDGHRCEGDERPHERGLCGWRLAQAHSNLCFLLREVYHREHYHTVDTQRARRSTRLDVSTQGLVQRIYSIPLDVLADLDLTKDDWHGLLAKKSVSVDLPASPVSPNDDDDAAAPVVASRPVHLRRSNALSRRIVRLLLEARPEDGQTLLSSADVKMAAASRGRSRRSVVSGMVCDCCYNQCSPEELGTYC